MLSRAVEIRRDSESYQGYCAGSSSNIYRKICTTPTTNYMIGMFQLVLQLLKEQKFFIFSQVVP